MGKPALVVVESVWVVVLEKSLSVYLECTAFRLIVPTVHIYLRRSVAHPGQVFVKHCETAIAFLVGSSASEKLTLGVVWLDHAD